MKKLCLLTAFLFSFFSLAWGNAVSVNTAKTVGYHFLQQKSASLQNPDDLKLVYTSHGATEYFYVFSGANSFVIVSADDAAIPILGYSTESVFRSDVMPTNAAAFFESYTKQMQYTIDKNIQATPEISIKWNNLINSHFDGSGARTTSVSPLLSTKWDQSPYYNANCPTDPAGPSGHVVTGCVATAMSQVMKFWNWPTHGAGIHSYTTSSYGTLSANFGSTTYNWATMPVPSATGANAAVAHLMSDAGISVDMQYSATVSGAYVISATSPVTNCAEYALKTYFNYKPTLHGEKRSSYSDPTWTAMLKTDLDAGRPIVYDGFGPGGGHCFVLDGYDASGNFHINFGWSGYDDGYYSISAISPAGVGTGGGSGDYNSNQEAILGVEPNSSIAAASLSLYNYVSLSPSSTIGYYSAFSASTNIQNTGTTTFNGDFCAAAFDATTGTFISYIDSFIGASLPVGYIFSSPLIFSTSGLLAMLPGNYTIGIFYRPTGGAWVAVANAGSYTNFVPMSVVNHNYMELSAAMTPTPASFVTGSSGSVTLNIANYGSSAFSGSYDVSLYNLDGTFNSTIQTMTGMTLASGYTYTGLLTFSTSSVTAAPGTYFLAMEFNDGTGWYLGGADYYSNPIYINVVAPPPPPDVYEVNNTAATAYDLSSTLAWASDVAHTSTPGSNFHVVTDQDYYKIVLAPSYSYSISARINDNVSTDDGLPYSVDAIWSYSTDGGATWSAVYDDVMSGTISLGGIAGGTVIFHVSPHFAGDIGTYLLKIGNITRTATPTNLPEINLSAARIFPNPASELITVDISGTGAKGTRVLLTDMQGKNVYSSDITSQPLFAVPVNSIAAGMYFLQIVTDAGMINTKVTVNR